MARYGLASHVFVCRDEEHIVVLDLREDRYFTFEAARTAALAPLLPGWPASFPALPAAAPAAPAAEPVAAALLRRGWLLDLSEPRPNPAAKDATPASLSAPQSELLAPVDVSRLRIPLRTIGAFIAASLFAKFALRFWRLERVVRRVARRKERSCGGVAPADVEHLRQLVDVFCRLRVFLFSHREKCLQDSLALLEFLARHGYFPLWVFGVHARPFAAHCWVQHGVLVCNDTVEHSATYIPIMVV